MQELGTSLGAGLEPDAQGGAEVRPERPLARGQGLRVEI